MSKLTGRTHRLGGGVFVFGGYLWMFYNGYLLNIVGFVQLLIMYPFAMWGSVAPDLDHHIDSIPARDPISLYLHHLLHTYTGKVSHRSRQTHSWDITGGLVALLMWLIYYGMLKGVWLDKASWVVLQMVVQGFGFGILSHLFLDMLTPKGVYLCKGKKVRLVPKSKIFATSGKWEEFVAKVLMWVNLVLGVWVFGLFFGVDVPKEIVDCIVWVYQTYV